MRSQTIVLAIFASFCFIMATTEADTEYLKERTTVDNPGKDLMAFRAVTPFDILTILSGNANAPTSCYYCSRPCSSTICCTGSHPQCCRVNGRCGCCRW